MTNMFHIYIPKNFSN